MTESTLSLEVESFEQYVDVCQTLVQRRLLVPGAPMAILIGTSGHSPIQLAAFEPVVARIAELLADLKQPTSLWGGGDPLCKDRSRGRNIADVAAALLQRKAVSFVGAVQRNDWLDKTPDFQRVRVGYAASMAVVNGKKTFGGLVKDAPEGLAEFLDRLRKTAKAAGSSASSAAGAGGSAGAAGTASERKSSDAGSSGGGDSGDGKSASSQAPASAAALQPAFLPRPGAYPVAATMGYLALLPALCGVGRVVLFVMPRAGYITFSECQYARALLQHMASSRSKQGGAPAKAAAASKSAAAPATSAESKSASTQSAAESKALDSSGATAGSANDSDLPLLTVHALTWRSIGEDLTESERKEKSHLQPTLQLLKDMQREFPRAVFIHEVALPGAAAAKAAATAGSGSATAVGSASSASASASAAAASSGGASSDAARSGGWSAVASRGRGAAAGGSSGGGASRGKFGGRGRGRGRGNG